MEQASIHSGHSPGLRNEPPALECRRAALATAAAATGKHKFGETNPGGIYLPAPALPDHGASPRPLSHPRSPASRRQPAPILLLRAREAAWPASLAACLQSHPEKLFHDPPVR